MDKKEKLIIAGMEHFSKKGYYATSVQDIVSDCGIAKGTFYNFFRSKEDLLIEVFRYNHQQMLLRAKSVQLDDTLTPKEQLIRKLALELNSLHNNREFFLLLQKVVSFQDHKAVLPMLKKTKAAMLNWHKEWLLEVYGEQASPYIWDIVLFVQGALKEYVAVMDDSKQSITTEEAARKIVGYINTLVTHGQQCEPLLTEDVMQELETLAKQPKTKTVEERRDELLEEITMGIKQSSLSADKKAELFDAVDTLEKECHTSNPRLFLLRAVTAYVKEHVFVSALSSFEEYINELETLTKRRRIT
ncbi:transcriptional regulator, TetR family [Alteribacillus persepolensis]|uniref:Transcriptional regulator, TetR family n=1 Tax=Alteribacillus persepolensis TaxID=568899 RepID=A0A1G7Z7I9_9BACI|nr:TetR/AcrR family transcriptional regulator [Alteribacillus persepolensis]SDH04476.1 transcriptional regulator, TetR family [Alteribacillus persepolensis]